MNKWRPWLIDFGLLSITFLLLLFLLVPWGKKSLTPAPVTQNTGADNKIVVDIPETVVPLQSARERIAYLFGWTRPRVNPVTSPSSVEQPPTPVANWIVPLSGYVVDASGKYLYLFKNSINNQILKLPVGGVSKGWKLVAVNANEFLFEFEGKKYIVYKD